MDSGYVVLVERLFEAFAARDEDALLAIMDPDIDGIRRYLKDAGALWTELETIPARFREVGNHVVVMGRVKARARDGLEMDAPAAWVWRVENNRVAWGCVYGDRDAMPRSLQEGGRGESSDYLLGPAQHVSRTT